MNVIRISLPVKASFAAGALLLSCLATPVYAETPAELMQKGDAYDVQLQPKQALGYYAIVEKAQPNDPKVLVRIARQYRHLMQDSNSKSEKLKLGGISLDYGNRAAAVAPNDSDAQLSPAISYGKMLSLMSSKEQVAASRKIKECSDRAIKLNPQNDLAWHIQGRWHRVVADISPLKRTLAAIIYEKLPEASTEQAVQCFKKAIAINPNRLMHHIELGRAYAQAGQNEEAKKALNKGLSMPNLEKDDADFKAHGREALAKLR